MKRRKEKRREGKRTVKRREDAVELTKINIQNLYSCVVQKLK